MPTKLSTKYWHRTESLAKLFTGPELTLALQKQVMRQRSSVDQVKKNKKMERTIGAQIQ